MFDENNPIQPQAQNPVPGPRDSGGDPGSPPGESCPGGKSGMGGAGGDRLLVYP